jgi:hypothetical protein
LVATQHFRFMHGSVCVAPNVVGGFVPRVNARDANARRHGNVVSLNEKGRSELLLNALANVCLERTIAGASHEHAELVAAIACNRIGGSQTAREPAAHRVEQLRRGLRSIARADRGKSVEIEGEEHICALPIVSSVCNDLL